MEASPQSTAAAAEGSKPESSERASLEHSHATRPSCSQGQPYTLQAPYPVSASACATARPAFYEFPRRPSLSDFFLDA